MQKNKRIRKKILTGDRPSGPLHLGHYVGSLENRLKLQNEHDCFFIIADYEYLTDHIEDTKNFAKNIHGLVLDYLSVGIDPQKSVIFVESQIPQIAELNLIFSMMVKVSRLQRNPTIKDELRERGIESATFGFLGWPVTQAADILCVKADIVPVGEDQLPHIEQTREIARHFNSHFAKIFPVPEALMGRTPRLPGLDGKKMSKSLNNAIYLTDDKKIVEKKIKSAVTDPNRVHPNDPGNPYICNIFQYYKAFAPDMEKEIETKCKAGSIGCAECKTQIAKRLNDFLDPIRNKRAIFEQQTNLVKEILESGNKKVREIAQETIDQAKKALEMNYKDLIK